MEKAEKVKARPMSQNTPESVFQKLEKLFSRTERKPGIARPKTLHLLICVLIIGAHLLLLLSGLLQPVERIAYDYFMRRRPPLAVHPALILVEIDRESIEAIGPWPWPWNYHAQMVRILNEWEVDSIVFIQSFPKAGNHSSAGSSYHE